MKIYFPQWQGSGIGKSIEAGAKTILRYANDPEIVQIPLSVITAGKKGIRKHYINNYDSIIEQLERFKYYLENHGPKQIITIGGDCGLEIIPVSYLNQQYPNLGIIWFDAHADINRPRDSPSCNFHGMPLRTLLGEGEISMNSLLFSTLKASQIHYVGVRDVDKAEKLRIEQDSIFVGLKKTPEELIATLQSKSITHLYLHFDFDCLEPRDYNKTYYQVARGISIKEAENYIQSLKRNFKIVGSSILESTATAQKDLIPVQIIIDHLLQLDESH